MGLYYVVDEREVVTYEGLIETHEAYLQKQYALQELLWEWLALYPEDN